jgi:hypothetical protein
MPWWTMWWNSSKGTPVARNPEAETVLTVEVGWWRRRLDYLATLIDETGHARAARSGETPDAAIRDLLITNLDAIYHLADVRERVCLP